jgi:hypothetical protein
VKIVQHTAIGEVIPEHYEILVGKDTIAFIFKPVACHSYNKIHIPGKDVKIATIDTMLSFYLAFLYADRPYFDPDRILCMSKFLFDVEQKNRLEQKGVLRRFSITCYGHQDSIEEIKAEKAHKYMELKDKRGTKEYEEYFLSYKPGSTNIKLGKRNPIKNKTSKIKTKKNKTQRSLKKTLFDPYHAMKSK